MDNKEQIKFTEDLEEVVLRLHTFLRTLEEQNNQFIKKPRFGKKREKYEKDFINYIYYRGKIYAYIYVLEKMGSPVPITIKRLRGIKKIDDNTFLETKMYYSEVYGHFPSEQYLKHIKLKSKRSAKN